MEKHNSIKYGSFIGRHRRRGNLDSPRSTSSLRYKSPEFNDEFDESLPDVDHDQILIDIDRFTDGLSTAEDKTTPPEVPETVETFWRIITSSIRKSPAGEDTFWFESLRRLWKLKTALGEFPATPSFHRISKVLQLSMMFMEEELRNLLEDSRPRPELKLKVMSSKFSSFKSDRCPLPEPSKEEEFPGYSEEKTMRINRIVSAMISGGYENECSNVYSIGRKNAFYEQFKRLDFEKLYAEDVHRLNWDSLEADVSRWIRIVRHCSQVLIPAERKLGETVFSDHLPVFRRLFIHLVHSMIKPLVDYATAVAMTKRSAERLFKLLDMYEALRDLAPAIDDSNAGETNGEQEQVCNVVISEISSTGERIGEGAVNMFNDLENSIKTDAAKTPVPGGAVHPITRYVLNYIKCACEYGDTLEQIYQQNAKLNQPTSPEDMEKSPLSAQIISVMELLDGNLEAKSTLYKDPSLRYIFLMNNGRYILQKVKGSNEIKQIMGDNWCRRRSSEVRHYHKSYQRETWTRLLQCITQEGIQVNGKVNKQVLKERFKNFNAMFDEIHKTQSTWVVSEEQLLSELRVSISAIVIPAYRSFVGRYKHYFQPGRSMDKYIKYQPEDIEALVETLFEGNPTSMGRRRF